MPGTFEYATCAACGTLYLRDVPELAPYYPGGYQSFVPGDAGAVRRFIATLQRRKLYYDWQRLRRDLGFAMTKHSALLDVGSGSGEFLKALAARGYRNVRGIDPNIPHDRTVAGVPVLEQTIEDATDAWDIVLFNHSLEHVIDPHATVAAALARLRDAHGRVIVRIPIVGDLWRTYGTDWVQLDAPRHTFVPTERGMRSLIERSGGEVEAVVYDSGPFGFWGSEWYRSGRILDDALRSVPGRLALTIAGHLRYGRRARALNREQRGDQATFMVKAQPSARRPA